MTAWPLYTRLRMMAQVVPSGEDGYHQPPAPWTGALPMVHPFGCTSPAIYAPAATLGPPSVYPTQSALARASQFTISRSTSHSFFNTSQHR